jgi:energy-converting hydrogenase Eha subunit F
MTFREFLSLTIVAFLFFGVFLAVQGHDELFTTPLADYNKTANVPDPLIPMANIGKSITESEIRQQTRQNPSCSYAGGECGVNAANVVTSIVFGYRGYDTLGEATILFVAISGMVYMINAMKGGEQK